MANLNQIREEGKTGHQMNSGGGGGNGYSEDITTLSSPSNSRHLFPNLTTTTTNNSPKKLLVSPPNPSLTFPPPKLTRKDSLPLRPIPKLGNFSLGDLTNQHYISEVISDSNTPIKNNNKTRSEIANIPKTFVRKIKLSDFDNYLNNLTTVFEQYQINNSQVEGESSFNSIKPEGTNLGLTKKELPSLTDLPQHFQDSDFSLETAKSFNLVCSLLKKEEIVESEINLITSTELQDLLAHHMDLVETHLVHEIGERSEGFFSALSLLQNLEEETELSIQRIKELRECLGEIRQQQAKDNLLVIQLKRRRDNMDLLYETLNIIKEAWSSQSALEFLLENNDPLSALELIDELKTQLSTLPDPSHTTDKEGIYPIDPHHQQYSNPITSPKLSNDVSTNINCLENLRSYLEEKRHWAIKLLKDRFISIIVGESQITSKEYVDIKTALVYLQGKPTSPPTSPTQVNLDTSTLTRLNPIIISLLVNRQFLSTFSLVTEALIESLQNKISSILIRLLTHHPTDSKRGLPKELSAWEDSELGHQIKGVTFDIFLEIVTVTFYHIVLAFQKTKTTQSHVMNLVKDITSSSSSMIEGLPSHSLNKSPVRLPATPLFSSSDLTREMTVMTQSILDFSQTRCSHLLELRSTANVQLGLNDFYRLYQLVWHCITHLESFSGRSAAILRSSAITQTHTFFQHFHDEKMKYLTLNINSDSWASSPVAIEYQHIAGMIQHALHHGTNHPDFFFTSQDTHQNSAHIQSTLGKAVNKDQLMIDGTEYHVSLSGLALLKMVGEYLKCAFNLPSVTNDVSTRIISLIENFNHQVCQAVLGAGAMRTAGLNRISARHISLASQTLAMALALIPGLRRCLELALGPEKVILMGQLDRVTNDMSEHQSQLHSKLIAILADRAAVHLGRMSKVDWETGSGAEDSEGEQVSTYMRDLVNDVQSLHRIMTRYLKPRETQQIVTQVNQDYVLAVERAILTLPIRTPHAKRKLLRDVQYLIKGLSSLPTQVANLHHLEVVVNDITL